MNRVFHFRLFVTVGSVLTMTASGCAQTASEESNALSSRPEMSGTLNQMESAPDSAESIKMRRDRIEFLESADTNSDDVLTKEELSSSIRNRFDRGDRNGDGEIDFDDKPALAPRRRFERTISPMIERFDSDGSGSVSFAEFEAQPMESFEAFDTGGTGAVDLPDLIAAIESKGQN